MAKKKPLSIARIGKGGVPILTNGLTIKQNTFLEAARVSGFKNIAKLCRIAKIQQKSFYLWLEHSPTFVSAWNGLIGSLVTQAVPGAINALAARVAKTGDPQAARLLLELAGLSKQHIKLENVSDEELHARIKQLEKEAGITGAAGGSGSAEKGTDPESPSVPGNESGPIANQS